MFGEDYEYELQKGHLEKYPSYKGSVSVPKKMGYKAIFNNEDPDENENANGLGTKADPFVYEGFPPRPPKPTMKWLMKQLEKYDVGTGATRTSIYAEVTSEKANYPLLKETKGALSMTSYGEMSYALLPGTHIGDVKFTELLMQQMRDVAAGKVKPEDCLAAFQQVVIDDMKIMQENANNAKKEGTVKMGNSEQVERVTGVWNGKQVSFKKVWSGHEFTQSEIDDLLAGKTIVIEAVSSKSGKTFQCEGKLSEQEYNGKTYVGFENLGFIASFPDEWCEHKFTPDEKSLLEAGQRVSITAKSKKGKDFTTEVSYENGRIVPHFND
jgi:DNA topoisomerase-3